MPMQAGWVQSVGGRDLITGFAGRQAAVDFGAFDMLTAAAFPSHFIKSDPSTPAPRSSGSKRPLFRFLPFLVAEPKFFTGYQPSALTPGRLNP
jgi:hypothetical protein